MKWSEIPLFWKSIFLFWEFEITDFIYNWHFRIDTLSNFVSSFSEFYRLANWNKSIVFISVGTNFSNMPFGNTGLHIWNYFSGYRLNLSFIIWFSLNLAYFVTTCQFVKIILLNSKLFNYNLWSLKYHICNDSGYRHLSPPKVTSHLSSNS